MKCRVEERKRMWKREEKCGNEESERERKWRRKARRGKGKKEGR